MVILRLMAVKYTRWLRQLAGTAKSFDNVIRTSHVPARKGFGATPTILLW